MSYLEELFNLEGKVAAIIGGSGALGGEIAWTLAQAGAHTSILYYSNLDKANTVCSRIKQSGGSADAWHVDIRNEQSIQNNVKVIALKNGGVDILVNASGINYVNPVADISDEDWNHVLDINMKGVFLASRVFALHMVETGRKGSIINLSSLTSKKPFSNELVYGISKAAVNNMTRFLANEWASHGLRVNTIIPGFFPAEKMRKNMAEDQQQAIFDYTPMKRFGEVEELAGVVLWLASEKASSYVTGTIIPVDGGFSAAAV